MKENSALVYGIVAIVVILVFVGAWIATSSLSPSVYDVTLNFTANSSTTLYPYLTSAFNIIVANNGGKEVVGLPVAFYLNGVQRNFSTYTIPAHQSIEIEENYTYINSGGYLFTAVVDPGNVLNIANRNLTRQSRGFTVLAPQQANVYESVPNSNIIKTDSFTTSGTGLLTGSIMASLYNISSLGINGTDGGILAKTYQDLYPYIAVANGAYSNYSNGTASYAAWLQGTVTTHDVAVIVSSFSKKVSLVNLAQGQVEYSALANTISLCSYYQSGWTKIVEFYNDSDGSSCLGILASNYTPSEANALASALGGTRLGNFSISNATATNAISWSRFYYNNATVLGQSIEYEQNSIGASTLFELQSPQGIFLSTIDKVKTNVSSVNSTCYGLTASINGTSVCSGALLTTGSLGNQTYGAIYTKSIFANYTVGIYSLIGETYFTLAHANAAELISKLGINSSSVVWQSPFKSSCHFESGFGCKFNSIEPNGNVSITLTNLNYTTVGLDNITCAIGGGFSPTVINSTVAKGDNLTLQVQCHSVSIPEVAAQTSFGLSLGYTYKGNPMIVNGTLNVSNSG